MVTRQSLSAEIQSSRSRDSIDSNNNENGDDGDDDDDDETSKGHRGGHKRLLSQLRQYFSSMRMIVLLILCLQNSLFTVLRRYSQGVLREVYSKVRQGTNGVLLVRCNQP
jgi:hypothetical protein